MLTEARRDTIPAVIIFIISLVLNGVNFITVAAALPIVFYVLYAMNLIQPAEMYVPAPAKGQSFSTEMFDYPHPILMPKALYAVLGVMYLFLGIGLFLIFPLSRYFLNWASLCWKMSSSSSRTEPVGSFKDRFESASSASSRPKTPPFQAPPGQNGKFQQGKFKEDPDPGPIPSMNKTWSQATRQERAARSLEKNVLLHIEKNDRELRSIQETFNQALDSIFGGSELTKARFRDGMEKAVRMSSENLQAARDYVKVGHNPDVLQKFLSRSDLINKETGDLLDALVAHQQNQMEKNLQGLTDSLDELQDSLKYYK